jgi:hypothetical protein
MSKFWRDLLLKMLVYFTGIWYSLLPFGMFYGYLVDFSWFWIDVGIKKSGNPILNPSLNPSLKP